MSLQQNRPNRSGPSVYVFLFLSSTLVGLSIYLSGTPGNYTPGISESEDRYPASYANRSLSNSEGGSIKDTNLPFQTIYTTLNQRAEIEAKTGIISRRAREVTFNSKVFSAPAGENSAMTIKLNLFDDYSPIVVLHPASRLGVNDGMYNGEILSDKNSEIHLIVSGGQISGTVMASGRSFQIMGAGGGLYYILETEPKTQAY